MDLKKSSTNVNNDNDKTIFEQISVNPQPAITGMKDRSKASKKKDKKKGREKKSRSTSSTETEKQPTAVVGQPDFSIYPATREPQKDQPAKIEEENGLSFNQIVLIVVCASVLIYILRSRS